MGSSLAAGGVQVLPDTVQFIKLIHRDDRSDCAAVALDDDVLAAFSVLAQACDAAGRPRVILQPPTPPPRLVLNDHTPTGRVCDCAIT